MGKLPYIADKDLYFAVSGAISWIRETGYFNKATQYYANKYGVDVDEVRRLVRIAQGNGQREANREKPTRKYKWFAVEYSMGAERNGFDYFVQDFAQYEVRRGISAESVQRTMSKNDDYISEYSPCHWFGRTKGFDTREQAEEAVEAWKKETR